MSAPERRRDDLFDLAVANPEGITIDDMSDHLGVSHRECKAAIRDLRLFLGDYDDINFPCDPGEYNERWVYRLVGTLDDVTPWVTNRIGDGVSRIRTIQAMSASMVAATDGRTVEGKMSRLMERQLTRLVEDLDSLADLIE